MALRARLPGHARPRRRDALFAHVYAEPHPLLEEERAAYAEYLAAFDPEA